MGLLGLAVARRGCLRTAPPVTAQVGTEGMDEAKPFSAATGNASMGLSHGTQLRLDMEKPFPRQVSGEVEGL